MANVQKNPNKWAADRDAAWVAAYIAALDSIRDPAYEIVWEAAADVYETVWEAGTDVHDVAWLATASDVSWEVAHDARYTVRGAIVALIAYDNCAYLLDEKPEDVLMLGLLGNDAAILIYPACVALQKKTT